MLLPGHQDLELESRSASKALFSAAEEDVVGGHVSQRFMEALGDVVGHSRRDDSGPVSPRLSHSTLAKRSQ